MKDAYRKNIMDVLADLSSHPNGLSYSEAKEKLEQYGPNELKKHETDSALKILGDQFKSPIVWILIIAMIISFAVGELADFMIIGAIVILNAILGFTQEFRAAKAIESLQKLLSLKATVLRDGKPHLIDAKNIVPGDIIILETGDKM